VVPYLELLTGNGLAERQEGAAIGATAARGQQVPLDS